MSQYCNVKVYESQTAVIQLIGDMSHNIQELIRNLNCNCGANGHLRAIFTIYSNKIHKLRSQRDHYKRICEDLRAETKVQALANLSNHQSDISTRQSFDKKEDSNVFQLLQRQLVVPMSLRMKIPKNKQQSDLLLMGLNNQNSNPQDSLLISESSEQHYPSTQHKKSKNLQESSFIKSFQQFLQEKVQQNHSKLKISQDMIELTNKKCRLKINEQRAPLIQKPNQARN